MKRAPWEGIVPKTFAPVKTVLKRSLQPFNKKQVVKCPLLGCLEPVSLVSTGACKGAFSAEGLDASGLCPGAGVRGLSTDPVRLFWLVLCCSSPLQRGEAQAATFGVAEGRHNHGWQN